jgi:hypothetical protein
MTTFPAIKPNTRAITLGDTSQLEFRASSRSFVRFLTGSKRIGHTLSFSYESIAENEYFEIFNHYNLVQGGLIPFALPAVIWEGYSTVPVDPAEYSWKYAAPLQINTSGPGRFSVSVQLESVII